VRIENAGILTVPSVKVALGWNAIAGEVLATFAITDPRVAGASYDVWWTWEDVIPIVGGSIDVFAVVDQADSIDEFDENNNVRSTTLTNPPASSPGDGDAVIHTAFDPAYLLDALKTITGVTAVLDVEQNGLGCAHHALGRPAMIYDRYDPVVRWVVMPINAGLPATRENLGSNYPKDLDDEQSTP